MDKYVYIAHHGIKGQKWGVRRYQNPDGTLTEAGKRRYVRNDTAGAAAVGGVFGGYGGAVAGMIGAGAVNPALIPLGAKVGGGVGALVGASIAGKNEYSLAKEAVKKSNTKDEADLLQLEISDRKAYAKRDYKQAISELKDYFDSYPKEDRDKLLRIAKKCKTFDEFDKETFKAGYGDHASDVLFEKMETIAYNRQKARESTNSGYQFYEQQRRLNELTTMQALQTQQQTQQQLREMDQMNQIMMQNNINLITMQMHNLM